MFFVLVRYEYCNVCIIFYEALNIARLKAALLTDEQYL